MGTWATGKGLAMAGWALGLCMTPPAAAADRVDVARACWTTEALAARPTERAVRRDPNARGGPPPLELVAKPAPIRGAIRRVELPPGRKLVALTLDFCETPGEVAGYDGAIIDILRRERVPATLFLGGRWIVTHGERSEQLSADPLFEIASHGWAHRNVRLLPPDALREELLGPSAAYRQVRSRLLSRACVAPHAASIPDDIRLFRFPFGACNAAALDATAAAGLLAIQWDVSTGDPDPHQSAAAIAERMISGARPGSILLAHANGRGHHTAEALPAAIKGLRARGFEFVTVGELLAAGRPIVTDSCYDARPGDTDKYDFLGRTAAPPPAAAPTPKLPNSKAPDAWHTTTLPR